MLTTESGSYMQTELMSTVCIIIIMITVLHYHYITVEILNFIVALATFFCRVTDFTLFSSALFI